MCISFEKVGPGSIPRDFTEVLYKILINHVSFMHHHCDVFVIFVKETTVQK